MYCKAQRRFNVVKLRKDRTGQEEKKPYELGGSSVSCSKSLLDLAVWADDRPERCHRSSLGLFLSTTNCVSSWPGLEAAMAGKKDERTPLRIWANEHSAAAAQLTLVEHSLCPLKPPAGEFTHQSEYFFYRDGKKQLGRAHVHCPMGLYPDDERYLRKLLALALRQDAPEVNFYAGVRYLLRGVGLTQSGRNSKHLWNVLQRLATVTYTNPEFYNPVRGEYHRTSFGFFSLEVPADDESFRPWRIAWDPIYFDYVRAARGHLLFNVDVLDNLRPASGRLYLLLQKLFHAGKRSVTQFFDVEHLCVNQLGFAEGLRTADYNRKLLRCANDLASMGAIADGAAGIEHERVGKGRYRVRFYRGPHFQEKEKRIATLPIEQQAGYDMMHKIGLDDAAIRRVAKEYGTGARTMEWLHATIAGMEKKLPGFRFQRTPAAFFINGVQSGRTPPDCYFELKRSETRRTEASALERLGFGNKRERKACPATGFQDYLRSEAGVTRVELLMREVFGGRPDAEAAAVRHLRHEYTAREVPKRQVQSVADLVQRSPRRKPLLR